jgi:NADH:flavin oxidoreductases, Old Yellow Enzyme family
MANLFSEITIKNHVFKNRVVMPPMVVFGLSDIEGFVNERHVKHYEDVAKGGAGLIIIEATCVNKDGRLANPQLGIWDDKHIEGLRKIGEACHKYGAKVLVQIHHAGLLTVKTSDADVLCPSDYDDGKRKARAMTIEELHGIQKDFVDAALRAEKAGLDGIELHGAHGYLICQFASPLINKRTDIYGGSLENRARFACEIIDEIKLKVGKDFIIGCRMGGNEPTVEEGIEIAKLYEKHGIDLLHVSAGMTGGPRIETPEGFQYNWIVYVGTEVKKHVNVPVIVVNDIRTPERASYLVESSMADFTAIGKGHLVDPEWANKAKSSRNVKPCLKCKRCQWFVDGEKCPGLKAQ